MTYSFAKNLRDSDGDVYEECILVFVGEDTIIKFETVEELEEFAEAIKTSIKEIRETH